jgi:Lrp/AsnC family leucine-responsive transcriptional regulator
MNSNKSVILDLLDRKLLQELDGDSTLSFSLLAKKLKSPPETLRYRYNSLTESGVIQFEYAVVDAGKLGSGVHKILLKLHNVDEQKVSQIIAALTSHPKVNWVARFDGVYDIGFTIWIEQLRELSEFIDWLREKFHNFLNRVVFAVNIEAEFFPRDFSQNPKYRTSKQAAYTTPKDRHRCDELDLFILRKLAKAPRTSNVEIAEAANVTSETVGLRVSRLEKAKVITGYRLVVDCQKLGWINYYVFLNLKHVSAEKRGKLVEFCRKHPLVNYLIKALGEWDYELNVEARNTEEYRKLMMEITKEFSEIVRDYYAVPVVRLHKFSVLP